MTAIHEFICDRCDVKVKAIKHDDQGDQVKVDSENFKQLFSDPNEGFERYMESKGIDITSQQHQYPDTQSEAEKQQAVKAAINQELHTQEDLVVEESLEAEEPQSSINSGV